jgi:hypothetical protein
MRNRLSNGIIIQKLDNVMSIMQACYDRTIARTKMRILKNIL